MCPPGQIEELQGQIEEDRVEWMAGRSIREQAARGVVVNSVFQVGLAALGLVKRVAVAGFLTASEFGLWGLLLTTLVTLAWLKQIGLSQKYVQQSEADQELAFRRAFTLELIVSLLLFGLIAAVLPLYGLAYGREGFVVAGLVLGLTLPLGALQTPIWIAYRQMRFLRQRVLSAIDPVVSAAVTIGLAIAGAGYWSLIIGAVAGTAAAGLAAVATSPYRLAIAFDRETVRSYFGFSWPLFVSSAAGLVTIQGAVVVGNFTVGLAGLGAIALANSFAAFVDRADDVIRETLYPAACAVRDRSALLFEAFTKSNRMALMWSLPFGVGLALFAGDLVDYVLGRERWDQAEFLLAAFGLILGVRQIGFNWSVFMAAVDRTRPMAVSGVVQLVVFAAVTAPFMFAWDLEGYVAGMSVAVAIDIAVRTHYLRQLFGGFKVVAHSVRAIAPVVAPAALILAIRSADLVDRTAAVAVAELALYSVAVVASIWTLERALLTELLGYLRGSRRGLVTARGDGATSLPSG
jgi:PST family polysaccharide transporter